LGLLSGSCKDAGPESKGNPRTVSAPEKSTAQQASIEGLDPNGEVEVFGKAPWVAPVVNASMPTRAFRKSPADGRGPSTKAANRDASSPSLSPSSSPASVPSPIALEFEEGDYPYSGPRIRMRDGLRVVASSTLCSAKKCYEASRLVDNDDTSAWCEGSSGTGAGTQIALNLSKKHSISQITFSPGYAKGRKSWLANARPHIVDILTDEGSFRVEFPKQEHVFDPNYQMDFMVPVVDFALRMHKAIVTKTIQIHIQSTWPGSRYPDMCISEIALHGK